MSLFGKLSQLIGRKSVTMGDPAFYETLSRLGFGSATKSGASVNAQTALEVSTVMSCVRVIAEGVAQVPFKVYQAKDGKRESANKHPLYDKLHAKPNAWMSSFQFRETMTMHAVLTGKAFAYISRSAGGKVLELIPLLPGCVTVKQAPDYTLAYQVRGASGDVRDLSAQDVWHWNGPSWDGVVGLDMTRYAREAIGLAMATEETQSTMHKNGLNVSGLYSVEGTLNKTQHSDLTQWLIDEKAGVTQGGVMVLDRNAKYTPIGQKAVDAQHLETRRHQVEEICRMFRVMPIMAGFSDKAATYASAEAMFQAHVVYTLAAWYERIEQSANCQLLTDAERLQGYYTKHTVAGLLRGSMKDTADYLHKLVLDGILTRNEARELLEFNPLDGLDVPLTPANTIVAADPAAAQP